MCQDNSAPAASVPALQVEGLRFRYATNEPLVLDVPSLTLERGERVLLTGGSGSGKSTLLQVIAGLIDPDEGTVHIGGRSMTGVRGAKRDRLRGRSIGMLFQTFNLLPGFSAVENVMLPMMFSPLSPSEHRPRALQLLEELGIDRPGAPADRLSIGQQQRVATARAIACGPSVVLADEPTASLDPANAEGAIELIRAVCRHHNAALVCVSHDPSLAERFDRRIDLADLNLARPEPEPA